MAVKRFPYGIDSAPADATVKRVIPLHSKRDTYCDAIWHLKQNFYLEVKETSLNTQKAYRRVQELFTERGGHALPPCKEQVTELFPQLGRKTYGLFAKRDLPKNSPIGFVDDTIRLSGSTCTLFADSLPVSHVLNDLAYFPFMTREEYRERESLNNALLVRNSGMLWAKQDIKRGEQIGVNYGEQYWFAGLPIFQDFSRPYEEKKRIDNKCYVTTKRLAEICAQVARDYRNYCNTNLDHIESRVQDFRAEKVIRSSYVPADPDLRRAVNSYIAKQCAKKSSWYAEFQL